MPEVATELKTYRFDQMAVQVKDKIHPDDADVDRYVGLEHIDPESLKIRRWGEPGDVESTKILFRAGDIIFGKRRAYQRKLAVADFDGICSAHAMVLRPKTDVVLKDFLPFFMQTDTFMERAVKISVGGLSPTINWKDLAKEEFALPPIEEQRRIASLLNAIDVYQDRLCSLEATHRSLIESRLTRSFSVGDSTVSDYSKSVTKGTTPRHMGRDYVATGIPFLRGEDLQNVPVDPRSVEKNVDRDTHELLGRSQLQPGDVLLSIAGTIGRVGLVSDGAPEMNCNQAVCVIRPDDPAMAHFLFFWLQSRQVQDYIRQQTIVGTIPNLNLPMVRSLPVPALTDAERREFVQQASDAAEESASLNVRMQQLARLRALSLNIAISGGDS